MQIGRRPVLQGFAAIGIAAVTGGFRLAESQSPVRSTRCLVLTERTHGEHFLAGVQSVFEDGAIEETALLDLDFLLRILASGQERLLLGLVDDGVAAIVIEMARDAGARLRWLGHHTVRGGETQHQLLTASHRGGMLFTQALNGCASPSTVTHCTLAGPKEAFSISGGFRASPTISWAVALGAVLASTEAVDAGSYRPPSLQQPSSSARAGSGSFVSFGLEL